MTTTQNNAVPSLGAEAALAGYEYQLDVSVLAALRLMLVNNSTDKLTLEPANEEDLEADLEPCAPGRVIPSGYVSGGYKLVVQVKLSNGEPWSVDDFDRLLKHGKVRKPAYKHLERLDTHFLLVTSAAVKGVAMDLQVADFEESPDPNKFPRSLGTTLQNQPEGRVAIWGGLNERQLQFEIDHILNVVLRIPYPLQESCRQSLRDEARQRMRGKIPGVWTKADLMATVGKHGGYLTSIEELKLFVEPANFSSMTAQLDMRNAIVISGSSGTGKTMAALALCDRARLHCGGLNVVTISPNDGPAVVRRIAQNGPTLFYIEDPWGQISLHSQADSWAAQLPNLLKSASPAAQYVITSRYDMLREVKAIEALKLWMIELNAEHYDGGELEKIYDKRMANLPAHKQSVALKFRRRALDRLKTPQELQSYFGSILGEPAQDEGPPAFLSRILDEAHRDAVADVVFRYLNSFNDTRIAAAIWALLVPGSFSRQQLVSVQRTLRGTNLDFGDELTKAIDRLIATKHLRQPAQIVSYSHPSVREGVEKFLGDNWFSSSSTLESMITSMIGVSGSNRQESMEAAVRVLIATLELVKDTQNFISFPHHVQVAIDAWIAQSLIDPSSNFPGLIRLAAEVGSQESIPSELARWFLAQTQPNPFDDPRSDPIYSPEWFQRVRNEVGTATITDRFVREMFLQESDFVNYTFIDELELIATGLTPAFLAAAEDALGCGFRPYVDILATGAVRDIDGYERVLDKALDAWAQFRTKSSEQTPQLVALIDGDNDVLASVVYEDLLDQKGNTEHELINAYIVAKRRHGDWRHIAKHPRMEELKWFWAAAIARKQVSSSSPSGKHIAAPSASEEIEALLAVSQYSTDEAAAWEAATLTWSSQFEGMLAQRLTDDIEVTTLIAALVKCAVENAPQILKKALRTTFDVRPKFVSLIANLYTLARESNFDPIPYATLEELPEAQHFLRALGPMVAGSPPTANSVLTVLEDCASFVPVEALATVVQALIAAGRKPSNAIQRWLTLAVDAENASAAARAAVDIEDQALVDLALAHERADARSTALTYLSRQCQDLLPPRVLQMSDDRSSKVRLALIEAMKGRLDVVHEDVLAKLIYDQWSESDEWHQDPLKFTVAREALQALLAYPVLKDSTGDLLLKLAATTPDRTLSRSAFRIAASHCGESVRQSLWELANDVDLQSRRADVMIALSRAPFVEPAIVETIDPSKLLAWPPAVTVAATELLAKHGELNEAVRRIEAVAQNGSHKVLLLVGAFSLAKRDRKKANNLLFLLADGHPARLLLDYVTPLPQGALDDLGDVRLRHYVGLWLKARLGQGTVEIVLAT